MKNLKHARALSISLIALASLASQTANAEKREVAFPLKQTVPYFAYHFAAPRGGMVGPMIEQKNIWFAYETDDSWMTSDCGRYAFQYMTDNLAQYTLEEQAGIFTRFNEIQLKEAPSFLFHKPAPKVLLDQKRKIVTVQFRRDEKKSGVDYCGLGKREGLQFTSGPMAALFKAFYQWSGRAARDAQAQQWAQLPLPAAYPAPQPMPQQQQGPSPDSITQDDLSRALQNASKVNGGLTPPCPTCPPSR